MLALETSPRTTDSLRDGLNGFGLPDDHLAQFFLEMKQLGRLFDSDLCEGDAGPHGNDLSNIFLGYSRGVCTIPSGLQSLEFVFQLELCLGQRFCGIVVQVGIGVI